MDQLFPLPLTLWEEFFLVDDHEQYPANFMVQVHFQGRLPEPIFMQALANSVPRHPLFECQVSRVDGRWCWTRDDSARLPVEQMEVERQLGLPLMHHFSVQSERLWKMKLIHWVNDSGEPMTNILIEIHHSLCDGMGAIQFISDVAREIHDLTELELASTENRAPRPKLNRTTTNPNLLPRRGVFRQSWQDWARNLRFHYRSLLSSFRLVILKVASLVPLQDVPVGSVKELLTTPKSRIGYHQLVLSPTQTSWLRRVSRLQDSTVNSLVAAELFRPFFHGKRAGGMILFRHCVW